MDAYIYGERLPLPEGFAAYHDRWRSAVVSIDMHQGHLADTPDCPCPAPRARELWQSRRVGNYISPIIQSPMSDGFRRGGVSVSSDRH